MEKFLLDKGYSASAIYGDLQEVDTQLQPGQNSLVYLKGQDEIAQKIKQEVTTKFPTLGALKVSAAPNLRRGNIQFRLF